MDKSEKQDFGQTLSNKMENAPSHSILNNDIHHHKLIIYRRLTKGILNGYVFGIRLA